MKKTEKSPYSKSMKTKSKIILLILMSVLVSLIFTSCDKIIDTTIPATPSNPDKPDEPNNPDKVDKPIEEIFSYEITDGMFSLNYDDPETSEIKIGFFTSDWKWVTGRNCTFSKKTSIKIDIFDEMWLDLWKKLEKRPETQNIIIQVSYNNVFEADGTRKMIFGAIKSVFDADSTKNKAILDRNDYASRKVTPKEMTFMEESARDAVEKMKMGWNLSNHFEVFSIEYLPSGVDLPPVIWETFWSGKETTLEQIRYMKSLGFKAVRIPVTWMQHLDENDNILPGWMNRIQEVVDWCLDEGFYVILNTHHDSGANKDNWIYATDKSFNEYNGRYKKIWEQICNRFGGYGEKQIFANANEICEEVGSWSAKTDHSHEIMLKWNQLFVDTVRASGGNNAVRNISVSGLMTDGTESVLSKTSLPKDSASGHLIFEFHCYDPWNFCGDGDFVDSPYVMNTFEETKFVPERTFGYVYEFGHKNGVPVIIGEWGVLDGDGKVIADAEKAKYAKVFVSEATKRGFALFNWGAQWYFGHTSIDDAKNPNPLYLKAVQDNISETEPYKPLAADFVLDGLEIAKVTFEKNYDYVDGVEQETYQTYLAMVDVTDLLKQQKNRLPKFGESIKVSFSGICDKELKNLTVFLLDNSKEAGWWLDICGYNNRIQLKDVSAGVSFSVDKMLYVATPPKEKVVLRFEYQKSDLDVATTIQIGALPH